MAAALIERGWRSGIVGAVPFRPDRRSQSVAGLLTRFAIAGLLSLLTVAAVTGWVSRRAGVVQARHEAVQLIDVFGHGIVQPALSDALVAGDPTALNRFDELIRSAVLRDSVVRVKIWDASGKIVYSDEQRLIGQIFEVDEHELAVLHGGEPEAEISDLSKPENRYESPQVKLLEVYSGVQTREGTPLLFEAYFRDNTVVDAGRAAWNRYAPVSLGALGVLQLAQIPIVFRLVRRLKADQASRVALLQRSLDSSANERRRIAGDLHDGVVQDLSGVSFSLSALARDRKTPEQLTRPLQENADAIRRGVQGLRSLLVDIYPPNLAQAGLESALGDLVTRLTNDGLATDLRYQIDELSLPDDLAALLYRSALEATRNVARHARATRATVSVIGNGTMVELSVDDDGVGFDPTDLGPGRAGGHVGTQVLADLVADFGGRVIVESAPGQGTNVVVKVPLQ